jgi:hypothetical protein
MLTSFMSSTHRLLTAPVNFHPRPKFPLTPLFATHPKKCASNSFRCHTYKNTRLKVLSLPHIFKFKFYRSISERHQHRLSIFPHV